MYKLTIDTNIQLRLYKALHFSEGPFKIVKIFEITVIKTSLLLCSMKRMWPKLVLATHEQEWRNPVSGLCTKCHKDIPVGLVGHRSPNSEKDSIKSSFKNWFIAVSLEISPVDSQISFDKNWFSRFKSEITFFEFRLWETFHYGEEHENLILNWFTDLSRKLRLFVRAAFSQLSLRSLKCTVQIANLHYNYLSHDRYEPCMCGWAIPKFFSSIICYIQITDIKSYSCFLFIDG
jgi:hypothetical protein